MAEAEAARNATTTKPWREYREEGVERALSLGNRGPMRFDADGRLTQDILDAYRRFGFHVFRGVFSDEEVAELAAEFDAVLDNAPTAHGGTVDKHGRPVKFPGYYTLHPPEDQNGDGEADAPAVVGLVYHPHWIDG